MWNETILTWVNILPVEIKTKKNFKQKRERRIPFYSELGSLFERMPTAIHNDFVFISSKTGRPYSKNVNRDYWN
jgi:hypothetical protein